MPRHYQLDAEEFALVQAFRKATPLRRVVMRALVDEVETQSAWVNAMVKRLVDKAQST